MSNVLVITDTSKLVIDYRAREWCKLPYPSHPHGCPNYNHKPTCPPEVCRIEEFMDISRQIWVVVEEFDLGAHVRKMHANLPHWTDRQCRNVLYWQGHVNATLAAACKLLAFQIPGTHWTTCPEAMGVNVIRTVKGLGIPIQPRPAERVFKVGLVGYRRRNG